MQYYNHHIGDFKRDTSFLCHKKRSIYLELIWLYYDTESCLPNDMKLLARKCECDETEIADILELFFVEEDDGFHHKRIDEELRKVYERSEKAKVSAFKRWQKKPFATRVKKKPKDNKMFDEFFELYPSAKRIAKDKCLNTWNANKLDKDFTTIIAHLKQMVHCEQWKNPQYIPNMHTYLNQKRWSVMPDNKWETKGI